MVFIITNLIILNYKKMAKIGLSVEGIYFTIHALPPFLKHLTVITIEKFRGKLKTL